MTTIATKIVGWVALVLGLVASILTFLPRVSVEVGQQIDPLFPYKVSFTITNTGYVSLKNVKTIMGLCNIQINGGKMIPGMPCDEERTVRLLSENATWLTKQLGLDERYTIRLDDILAEFQLVNLEKPSAFEEADISIIISYEPWILPLRREAEFRFFTRKERNGSLIWMQRPLAR